MKPTRWAENPQHITWKFESLTISSWFDGGNLEEITQTAPDQVSSLLTTLVRHFNLERSSSILTRGELLKLVPLLRDWSPTERNASLLNYKYEKLVKALCVGIEACSESVQCRYEDDQGVEADPYLPEVHFQWGREHLQCEIWRALPSRSQHGNFHCLLISILFHRDGTEADLNWGKMLAEQKRLLPSWKFGLFAWRMKNGNDDFKLNWPYWAGPRRVDQHVVPISSRRFE